MAGVPNRGAGPVNRPWVPDLSDRVVTPRRSVALKPSLYCLLQPVTGEADVPARRRIDPSEIVQNMALSEACGIATVGCNLQHLSDKM
jgi:hypothetical protein